MNDSNNSFQLPQEFSSQVSNLVTSFQQYAQETNAKIDSITRQISTPTQAQTQAYVERTARRTRNSRMKTFYEKLNEHSSDAADIYNSLSKLKKQRKNQALQIKRLEEKMLAMNSKLIIMREAKDCLDKLYFKKRSELEDSDDSENSDYKLHNLR